MHGLTVSINDPLIIYPPLIIIIALIISLVLAFAALRIRVITRDAVIPSTLVGFMILLGGPSSILPFIVFLGSSSALTKIGIEKKEELGAAEDVKGRNWKQVLAVGLVPSTLALLAGAAYFNRDMLIYQVLITASVTGIATQMLIRGLPSSRLSRSKPRLIVRPWVTVDPGVSGGVTLLGELSSFLGGSSTIALTYLGVQYLLRFLGFINTVNPWLVAIVLILGYLGRCLTVSSVRCFSPSIGAPPGAEL
ncbi:DUF92 domain-containing protein [Vulcanisaeta souniana]|uniref:DUF92 domain-containing protein n=1 Tax=Vulcanisaeta souniana TaxID=164452 RepID=UPI000A6743AE|nr:DUF92 domain-containing protein [Vulcanisaeta souniana]